MSSNLTLCLLFNLLSRNPQKPIIRYSNQQNIESHEEPNIQIQINYISQSGNANIVGNGTATYTKERKQTAIIAGLEKENKLLCELLEMLKNRADN